jgi:hypothetical protein
MTKTVRVLIVLLFPVFLFQCGSEECAQKPEGNFVNPNGSSELALLMKKMWEENMELKKDLVAKKSRSDVQLQYASIHTAEATEPEKAASDIYKSMADAYLQSVERFEEARFITGHEAFNGMVDNCMNCHQQLCPGPMVRIKKLYIKEEEM